MKDLYHALAATAAQAWPSVLDHLWQSTLFALVLLPAAALLKRAPAGLRYSLSLAASLKFVLPSALFFLVAIRFAPEVGGLLPSTSVFNLGLDRWLAGWLGPAEGAGPATGALGLYSAITVLWLAGALAVAWRWRTRTRAFVEVLSSAHTLESGREVELLAAVKARLGIRRPVRLALLSGGVEPGVFRVWRPVLVLPEEMPGVLSQAELEAIFLHELAHVRRFDNLVASLHMVLCCVFWFHPLVWWLDRRLLAEREEACDERVLALGGRADTYARSLVKAVGLGLGWRLAGVSSASASNFRRRIERILAHRSIHRSSLGQRVALASVAPLLLAFSLASGTGAPAPAGPTMAEIDAEAEASEAAAAGNPAPAAARQTQAVREASNKQKPARTVHPARRDPAVPCSGREAPRTLDYEPELQAAALPPATVLPALVKPGRPLAEEETAVETEEARTALVH